MIARLAFALILAAPAAPALAVSPGAPMTAVEAVAYLNQNRARLVVDQRLEKRLTAWALTSFAGAVTAPSLKYAPDVVVDLALRKAGMGPLFRGSLHLYGFTLVGAIGAVLLAKSAIDLARLSPDLYARARQPVNYPRLTGLNHFLDLPAAEQRRRLDAEPDAAARIVALAELLRANPRMHLSPE